MKKSLIVLLFIMGTTLALSGCVTSTGSEMTTGSQASTAPQKTSMSGPKSHTVGIASDGFHESCEDEWKVGEMVKVSFTSTKPVLFNVHYHDAKHVKHYSINDMLTDSFSDTFTVKTGDVHCGMWQNNNSSFVKLTYEIEAIK